MAARHLILPTDFSSEELEDLFTVAEDIAKDPVPYQEACKGKLMASLFFEPSTRTRFSFEAAMHRLGGSVIGFSDPATTSASKGETLMDTTRIIASYVDLIVCRSPFEGAAKLMSEYSDVPVVNAGDGGHQHPTQTLTDLMTIRHFRGTFEGHVVGLCGDLKFGRTIHSLVETLGRYPGNRFVFISPDELRMPAYVVDKFGGTLDYTETDSLDAAIGGLDILYMSRVQKERFVSESEYLRLKDYFVLDKKKMEKAGKDLTVMHPLPRVNEISPEIDDDPRCVYFMQARLGVHVRMALLMRLLGVNLKEANQ
jgi:aspartate carbamoyltransferase catalytic subunit